MSDRLRKTEVTKVSKRLCETVYGIDSISYKIFCIYEEGFGPCVGDTGSPAKINDTLLGKGIEFIIIIYFYSKDIIKEK